MCVRACVCTCLCTVLTSVLEGPKERLKVLPQRAVETIRDAVDYNYDTKHKIKIMRNVKNLKHY